MNPIDEGRQFRALYRHFLFRAVDIELLSVSGEMRNLLGQFAALLAAYSFVVALFTISHYAQSSVSRANLGISAWGIEEFLISTTITATGIFAVLSWNAILPDRRDSFVLNTLPLHSRSIFTAKVAGIATALAISVIAVNLFTGISLPFAAVPAGSGMLGAVRSFLAYWLTMGASAIFMFASVCSLQNAAAMLSFRLFQRISGWLQLLVFFTILALFFLTPPLASPARLDSPANRSVLACLPSYWFLGLFHELNGTANASFDWLAVRAISSLGLVCLFGFLTASLMHGRLSRRIVEQPEISPGKRRIAIPELVSKVTRRLFVDPIDRAVFLFAARTLARSRQHRLVLAVYGGMAFAISLAYAKSLVSGRSEQEWSRPDAPLAIVSFVILFFAIIGSRAVFALPFSLAANWIFRISAVRRPAAYFSAVRKSLFALSAAPVLLISSVLYFSIWPGRAAIEHLLVLCLIALLLVQTLLRRFRKIPFACSYLPGKSNLRLKLGIAGFAFLFAVDLGASLEIWSMEKTARYAAVVGILATAAIWATRKTEEFAGSPYNGLQFEDAPTAEIYALDLRRDFDYANESDYLDAVSEPPRSFGSRIKLWAVGFLVLTVAGICYERFGEWRDRHKFPQIGRPIDIGGRSLNLYCSGSGNPTVVMESGGGVPGYAWKPVQSKLAKVTRACWYDRAGYGWSDPAPRSRTGAEIALDLHRLLWAAGIAPPYLLIGHSLGCLYARVFAGRYPEDVSGLILADSADDYDFPGRLPDSIQSPASRYIPKPLMPVANQILRFTVHAGLLRLLDNGVTVSDGQLSLRDSAIVHSLQIQPKELDASLEEGWDRLQTLAQVRAIHRFGDLPLIVLSGARKPVLPSDDETQAELLDRYMDFRIHFEQARDAQLSTRGRQIILADAGHAIPAEAPDAIVDAVRIIYDSPRRPLRSSTDPPRK